MFVFLFKQKTAYEMRISDWSSDVCSSDLGRTGHRAAEAEHPRSPHAKNAQFRTIFEAYTSSARRPRLQWDNLGTTDEWGAGITSAQHQGRRGDRKSVV